MLDSVDQCERALATILRDVAGEGDGESLDGRDPEVVVAAVRRRLKIRAANQLRGKKQAQVRGSRGSAPKQRKPIRPVSKKQAKKQRERREAVIPPPDKRTAEVGGYSPEFRLFVSKLACCIDLKPPPLTGVDPCHLKTKGNNGDWIAGGCGEPVGNIFPAMHGYHTEQHKRGIKTFASKYGRDLAEICRVVGEGYLRGLDPEDLSALAIRSGGYERIVFDG